MKDLRNKTSAVNLTVVEAARILGLGKSHVYDAINRGEIPVVYVGRRKMVPFNWLISTIDGRP